MNKIETTVGIIYVSDKQPDSGYTSVNIYDSYKKFMTTLSLNNVGYKSLIDELKYFNAEMDDFSALLDILEIDWSHYGGKDSIEEYLTDEQELPKKKVKEIMKSEKIFIITNNNSCTYVYVE